MHACSGASIFLVVWYVRPLCTALLHACLGRAVLNHVMAWAVGTMLLTLVQLPPMSALETSSP